MNGLSAVLADFRRRYGPHIPVNGNKDLSGGSNANPHTVPCHGGESQAGPRFLQPGSPAQTFDPLRDAYAGPPNDAELLAVILFALLEENAILKQRIEAAAQVDRETMQ